MKSSVSHQIEKVDFFLSSLKPFLVKNSINIGRTISFILINFTSQGFSSNFHSMKSSVFLQIEKVNFFLSSLKPFSVKTQ